jgi:hypothetical protein
MSSCGLCTKLQPRRRELQVVRRAAGHIVKLKVVR